MGDEHIWHDDAGVAGPALILAFALNGIITSFTAMSYAELGSAYPEAGGSYLWVKEGMGGTQGFLAGWMSWSAAASAGALYGLGFGRFASELWHMAGWSTFGLSIDQMTLIFMTLIIIAFTFLNYLGASETGAIGNIVTLAKIVILGLFVLFGIIAMLNSDGWQQNFTTGFLPKGFLAGRPSMLQSISGPGIQMHPLKSPWRLPVHWRMDAPR